MTAVNLLVHVEQYDVQGILPSQLESLALLARAAGVLRRAFIDRTVDGVRRAHGFERYSSLDEWAEKTQPTDVFVFTSDQCHMELRHLRTVQPDAWLLFGPAMGWTSVPVGAIRVRIPGGVLNSRDCVPIALWQVGTWPVP